MVQEVGADHVVCGTDYPYDMMQERVVDYVEGSGLTAEETEKVLSGNTSKLIGL